MIDRILERDWYEEYFCPILVALRVRVGSVFHG